MPHRNVQEPNGTSAHAVAEPFRLLAIEDPIKALLDALHADEIVTLADHYSPKDIAVAYAPSYLWVSLDHIRSYATFLGRTWLLAMFDLIFQPMSLPDRLTVIAFALVTSVVMFLILIWCLISRAPFVYNRFRAWADRGADGLNFLNAPSPHMFVAMSEEEVRVAREALSARVPPQQSGVRRTFNLDIAKVSLICAALMYERTTGPLYEAIIAAQATMDEISRGPLSGQPGVGLQTSSTPGAAISFTLGHDATQDVTKKLDRGVQDDTITRYAARMGLRYFAVSELNTLGSAYCGMFVDEEKGSIILSFKGTSASEFEEWKENFTYGLRDAGGYVRGFEKVHGGFLETLFPRKLKSPGAKRPWETISEAVRRTSAQLLRGKPPGSQINVWMTGHSLGCAIASLAYARSVNDQDLGEGTVVRDCYLFAAPILCDPHSVQVFNYEAFRNISIPRTMWRCTNEKDIVATGLPALGDHTTWPLSTNNLFTFAHLGTEIRMRSSPKVSKLLGNHLPIGSVVSVVTGVDAQTGVHGDGSTIQGNGEELPEKNMLAKVADLLHHVPIVSRGIDHFPGRYWDQLNKMQAGPCEWVEQ